MPFIDRMARPVCSVQHRSIGPFISAWKRVARVATHRAKSRFVQLIDGTHSILQEIFIYRPYIPLRILYPGVSACLLTPGGPTMTRSHCGVRL